MDNIDLSSTELVIALAGALVFACWLALILAPAMRCYGRMWEKLAAGFLTLYVLGTLLGVGVVLGLAVIWTYDQYWA